jgi:hypothetical protein
MTPATIAIPRKESPLLFEGMTWREFKAGLSPALRRKNGRISKGFQ